MLRIERDEEEGGGHGLGLCNKRLGSVFARAPMVTDVSVCFSGLNICGAETRD